MRLRRMVCREFLENIPCAVGGGVVDNNEFSDLWLREDFADDVRNG